MNHLERLFYGLIIVGLFSFIWMGADFLITNWGKQLLVLGVYVVAPIVAIYAVGYMFKENSNG